VWAVLVSALLAALPRSSRAFAALVDRFSTAPGAYALDETGAAARPYLIAALAAATQRPLLVIVSTSDLAERTYADLLTYRELGDGSTAPTPQSGGVALLRPRSDRLGALTTPSEQSARMTLLADLALDTMTGSLPPIIVAPLAALRQYLPPPNLVRESSLRLTVGESPGWEETLAQLHRLGYRRVDVVAAAGEYAVRGGLLDCFTATGESPMRIEFFGDEIESIRPFDLTTQRSDASQAQQQVIMTLWSEIPRDPACRERLLTEIPPQTRRAVESLLATGSDIPESWVGLAHAERATLLDYLKPETLLVLEEPAMLAALEQSFDEERGRDHRAILAAVEAGELSVLDREIDDAFLAEIEPPSPRLADLGSRIAAHPTLIISGAIEGMTPPWLPTPHERFVLETHPADQFHRRLGDFTESVRSWVHDGESVVLFVSGTSRMSEILHAADLRVEREAKVLHLQPIGTAEGTRLASVGARPVYVATGSIDSGFSIPGLRLRVMGDRDLFGQPPKRVRLRAVKEGVPVTLAELRVGDFVVHAIHGIGQYLGLRTETILGATSDYLDLRFAGTDRLLVPVHQMHQVTKYSASESAAPRLSKMGGADWARTKGRVSEALAKIAEGLVSLYAERELAPGHAYPPDTPWQAEVEEAFPYQTTPDQQKAIDETKADMERERPMDRLVCGDVGYGKTEVAIRAAFKAVADKRQVAVLVPTTLLAAQHARNFTQRFAPYPLTVAEISRFKSKKEQQQTLAQLADGKVDIIVGTHRLLQKDVVFANLGLIIVDEEQRFGVMHKERLKELRASVDVLTLSATPIPRTLHLSLLGVRDLSLIQTAPRNRVSIKTVVLPMSDTIIREAIASELDRGGQVYYVHNRVASIYGVARALQELVPKARIGIGHGDMNESELEPVMTKFIDGELDILVATTIIENGIDIPNVNTIIVNDADTFGLAQLYQLRGRVGRSNHQAYAYLLYQGHKALSDEAKARLEAIREFSHLGSGLQIAMRDLEIRGAGNLLGAAQSGFIGAVGFETYCQLLAEAIAERRNGAAGAANPEGQREAVIDVKLDAFIPNDYVPQVSQKIAIYQQLAKARTVAEVDEIVAGLRDRFGPLPEPLERLVAITHLRTIALAKHVTRVVIDERRLLFGVGSGFILDQAAIPRLQSLTKNRFRFGDGRVTIDLPAVPPHTPPRVAVETALPLVRQLLEAL